MEIKKKIRAYLTLRNDKIQSAEAIEAILNGTEFKGSSLWILVCAIFIASLGLNMNSTAVIIGAMLISPLMGPIMGIGLGLGINDSSLITRCVKNLAIATLFALLTSCLYFWISPLNDARSELLARTQPTIYDVLIAFFGGFAGIIATGSKSKGNILPGVAIATALMPPLCTAGYGLATLQFKFLFGAMYLFLINAVYIGLATWLGTIVLHLPKMEEKSDVDGEKQTVFNKSWAFVLIFLLIIPSVVTTVGIVRENVQESRVSAYIHGEFDNLGETNLISYEFNKTDSTKVILVNLLGVPLDSHQIDILAARMGSYGLDDEYKLKVVQGGAETAEIDAAALSGKIMKNVVEYYDVTVKRLEKENDSLRMVIKKLQEPKVEPKVETKAETKNKAKK